MESGTSGPGARSTQPLTAAEVSGSYGPGSSGASDTAFVHSHAVSKTNCT